MTVTVLRLSAPLMAWPASSRYRSRHTRPDPSFSAVQGLLACAAGVSRDASRPDWLARLSAAARIDIPGSLLRDFHTVNPLPEREYRWLDSRDAKRNSMVVKANGERHSSPIVTERFFREGQTVLLFVQDDGGEVRSSLESPRWAMYAGRKSCPFTFPLVLASKEECLAKAVETFPTIAPHGVYLDALFFQEEVGVSATRTESVFDEPAGGVGQDYLPRDRIYTRVDPPRVTSWWDVYSTRGEGGADVAQ